MTGSFINNVMADSKQPMPCVGDGATEVCWTDRRAYTIIDVIDTRTIKVQRDNAERVDNNGMSESQQYEYSPNPEAPVIIVTLRKNGRWIRNGEGKGNPFLIGQRIEYYDFNF